MRLDRERVRKIIFESDTREGRLFDVALIVCILLSVFTVVLDTSVPIPGAYDTLFYVLEWLFTIVFTLEYGLRLWSIERPLRYATSFYGLVDLLCILPTYVSLLLPGSEHLLAIRVLRLLRVFRIFRLMRFVSEANLLITALRESRRKITVFLATVLSLIVVAGSLMYVIEGPENGYTSIPASMYWAIVTVTTVGYGDISPKTGLGRLIASALMITGYAILAVPTGVFSVELSQAMRRRETARVCPGCAAEGHAHNASYCFSCGHALDPSS